MPVPNDLVDRAQIPQDLNFQVQNSLTRKQDILFVTFLFQTISVGDLSVLSQAH